MHTQQEIDTFLAAQELKKMKQEERIRTQQLNLRRYRMGAPEMKAIVFNESVIDTYVTIYWKDGRIESTKENATAFAWIPPEVGAVPCIKSTELRDFIFPQKLTPSEKKWGY